MHATEGSPRSEGAGLTFTFPQRWASRDAERNPLVDLASCHRLGARSILAAPLRHFRRTLGVFEVLSGAPHAFDNRDVAIMQLLSSLIVAASSRLSSIQPLSQRKSA